jgi:hypothetical protein
MAGSNFPEHWANKEKGRKKEGVKIEREEERDIPE